MFQSYLTRFFPWVSVVRPILSYVPLNRRIVKSSFVPVFIIEVLLNVYLSSLFVVQFCLALLFRVQFWSTLPKVDSNVAWFTLKSSSVLVFILVVLSPLSQVLPRLDLFLRSLHQFLSTAYL